MGVAMATNKVKVNERILSTLRSECGGDKILREFLIDLIFEETKSPSQYKELYKTRIEKSSSK